MKSENDTVVNNEVTCEMAANRNLTRCPFDVLPEKFYGTLTFKFVNGNIQQVIKEESMKL